MLGSCSTSSGHSKTETLSLSLLYSVHAPDDSVHANVTRNSIPTSFSVICTACRTHIVNHHPILNSPPGPINSGIAPFPISPLSAATAIANHPHSCTALKGTSITVRHNLVLSTIAKLLREVSHHVHIEPSFQQFSSGFSSRSLRPDCTVTSSDPKTPNMLLDISFTHPSASTY